MTVTLEPTTTTPAMCVHNDTWPAAWCADCRQPAGQTATAVYQYHEEDQLLAPSEYPRASQPTIHHVVDSLHTLSAKATWVHIAGGRSMGVVVDVINRCPELRLVQVPPCWRTGSIDLLLALLAERGIGFRYARVIHSDLT
jgi:hypothetical protein